MISEDLLKILCCPETHQPVTVADSDLVDQLNKLIGSGNLKNRDGKSVDEKLDGALIREDRQILFPVRKNIPVMMIPESIPFPESTD